MTEQDDGQAARPPVGAGTGYALGVIRSRPRLSILERGVLLAACALLDHANGTPVTGAQVAAVVGWAPGDTEAGVVGLVVAGLLDQDGDGALRLPSVPPAADPEPAPYAQPEAAAHDDPDLAQEPDGADRSMRRLDAVMERLMANHPGARAAFDDNPR